MSSAVVITGIKPPVKIRPNKKLGITEELAKEINKYRLIKQEAEILNKSLKSYGYDTAKQIKYDRYAKLYENHLEYLHDKKIKSQTIKSQTQIKKDVKVVTISKNAKELADVLHKYIKDVAIAKELGITLADIGYTQEQIDIFENKLKQHGLDSQKLATKMLKSVGLGVTPIIATQTPAAKERIKMPVSQYKPTIKGLKQSLLNQLNKRKWSESRNELIYKIEQMDESKLSQLYYENKEYFAIYYYGDSDIYIEDWDQDNFIYGYDDIVKLYEERYGAIV